MNIHVNMETLHWVDYVVFVVFMGVSLGIGVFYAFSGGRQRSPDEFLVGSRRLRVCRFIYLFILLYLYDQISVISIDIAKELY